MQARKITMEEALFKLGLTHADLEREYSKITVAKDTELYFEEANKIYQKTIREAHKKKAFEFHPDRCADEGANEKCAEVNFVAGELLKLKLMPKPKPQPVQQLIVINRSFGGTGSMFGSTTTSTTFSANGGFTWIVDWES